MSVQRDREMFHRGFSFVLLSVILIVSQVSFIKAQRNFDGQNYVNQAQENLQAIYPVNISNTLPKLQIDNDTVQETLQAIYPINILNTLPELQIDNETVQAQETLQAIYPINILNTLPELQIDNKTVQETLQAIYPINIFNTLPKLRIGDEAEFTSTKCYDQLVLLVNSSRYGAMWALKMIDASSKIPSGILMGNRMDLGMYDECLDIKASQDSEEIQGRPCMYTVKGELSDITLKETLSICMPASCEPEDIKIMLNSTLKMISNMADMDIPISISSTSCSSLETPEWTVGGIITLFGFSLLLLFLVVCTICDIFIMYSKINCPIQSRLGVLRQFSIYSNAVRVLSTKTTPQTLPALQGLRFFSMCWVIFGHEYFTLLAAATINPLKFLTWVHAWSSLYILIAPFAVDTFFTISGFLMSYLFLKEMSTGRRFNILVFYIHRYLRLTPALAALLLMAIFILPRVGSGPVWETNMGVLETNCRHNWWPMLLYVHNYVDKDHLLCLAHTWYLAVEMHFFWISPLILYPLAKKPMIGLIILGMAFVASVTTPTVIAYKNHYSTALFGNGDAMTAMEAATNFYMATHNRAAAWVIGVFYGYLVFVQKGSVSKAYKWIGWLSTIVAFAFCVFSMRIFQADDYVYEEVWETFYTFVSKPFWAGGVGWIIYASVRGFGGPITTILSFSIFHPLSRISYSVYLVHFIIQGMKLSALRVPRYFSEFNMFNEFLSDLVLSSIVGFIFTLIFESPILTLEKLIIRRNRRGVSESKEKLQNGRESNGID